MPSGSIVIVNGTEVPLRLSISQSLVNYTNFPGTIAPFSVADVYVRDSVTFSSLTGTAIYTTPDARLSFAISLNFLTGLIPEVSVTTTADGRTYREKLDWDEGGKTGFVVSGQSPNYFINNSVSGESWMQTLLPLFGTRCLRDITVPGSHDAGMSEIYFPTAFANAANTKTQKLNIHEQLMRGSRYFDIRPIIGAEHYWTGHFSYDVETGSYQGARGQSIDSVIDNINDFTETHNELVILNLSHDFNADPGNGYRPFTKAEYQGLLHLLYSRLKHLFTTKNDVTLTSLREFITKRSAVIVFVDTSDDFLGKGTSDDYTIRGFYRLKRTIGPHVINNGEMKTLPSGAKIPSDPPEVSVYDHESETEDLGKMMKDQIAKMENFSFSGSHSLFSLSWTLTLPDINATLNATQTDILPDINATLNATQTDVLPDINATLNAAQAGFKSIEELAKKANRRLDDQILPKVASGHRPSIVYLDYYTQNSFTALVVAINLKVLKG